MLLPRSLCLVQMLGLVRTEIPTFVLYEDLVNGDKFLDQYDDSGLIYRYLFHTNEAAISALRADKSLGISVSSGWGDWTFNLKSRSWHYDASTSVEQPSESFRYAPILLPEGPLPQLDDEEITTYFEKTFGDFLYLIASLGETDQGGLLDYKQHHRLTFGTVINYFEGGVPAHFPSTPCPEWWFNNRSRNIDVCYSEKVYSRVDFQSHNTHNTQLNLHFSLRLPLEDRTRLRAAYLCQSKKDSSIGTYFIDEIRFSVTGSFSHNPTARPVPAYLFIPPLHAEYIDRMYCISHPLRYPLFYWSWDPEGKTMISKEEWGPAEIPALEVETRLGSYWIRSEYSLVKSYLDNKSYDVDGKQYARDHGYPELIWGDPHDRRIELYYTDSDEDLEDSNEHGDSQVSDKNQPCFSTSQHTSSAASSLVDPPVKGASTHLIVRDTPCMENSGEETRRVERQQTRVQETARQADSSKDLTQRSNLNKHSLTVRPTRPNPSQGATGVPVDSHLDTSTLPTRPQAPAKAVTASNPRAQPKKVQERSLRTKAALIIPAQRSIRLQRLSKRPQRTKSRERESRNDTSAQTIPAEARGKADVHNGYPELRTDALLNKEMEKLEGSGGTGWYTASGTESSPDHKVPSPSTFLAFDTVNDWEGTTRVHSEGGGSSTAVYLAQCFESDTDNIAEASSQRNVIANSAGSTNEDKWDFLVVEDL
ncbi:hypothetical protein PQX77_021361 [Marasmius sp. AFHP31]|nr:hypothetical protein PQX77_021361 [Marasmius sp. AFHP31]